MLDAIFIIALIVWVWFVQKTIDILKHDIDDLKKDIRSLNLWRDSIIDSKEES